MLGCSGGGGGGGGGEEDLIHTLWSVCAQKVSGSISTAETNINNKVIT